MKILEICKRYCKEYYNNDVQKVIDEMDGVLFDDYRIKHAFNRGHGTYKDLLNFIENNKPLGNLYYDIENQKFI